MGMVAVVPVRESLHMKVRSQERLWAKEKYEKHKGLYKRNRYKIEQLIGNVKNIMDDRDNTRIYELASLYMLARFAVYNFLVLWDLYLFFEILIAIFRNQVILIFWDFSNSLILGVGGFVFTFLDNLSGIFIKFVNDFFIYLKLFSFFSLEVIFLVGFTLVLLIVLKNNPP
jgi:hypothetical protein